MVEYNLKLNLVFGSLGDTTRRDILRRVAKKELSIKELAASYTLTFAGVAKHIHLLEQAGLVSKRRVGKEQRVSLVPEAVDDAQQYLRTFEKLWRARFNTLDHILTSKK